MAKITLSITSATGSASLEIHGADDLAAGAVFVEESFQPPTEISTTVEQNILGCVRANGRPTGKLLLWPGVRILITEDSEFLLRAIANKSNTNRINGTDLSIRMDDEFHYFVEDSATNTRAISSGVVTPIGVSGAIRYHAAYNVAIVNIKEVKGNLRRNGELAKIVEFDMVELDKLTP